MDDGDDGDGDGDNANVNENEGDADGRCVRRKCKRCQRWVEAMLMGASTG